MTGVTRRALLGGAAALSAAALTTTPAAAAATGPALYLIPHQDDEVLLFGSTIRIHAEAGRNVKVFLFGQGETSIRTGKMADVLGYTPTLRDMGWVRDREFMLTSYRLGATYNDIYQWGPDQRLLERSYAWTVAACVDIIRKLLAEHPDADIKAPSPYDPNPDHARIGMAVEQLHANGELQYDPRYYLAPWAKDQVNHPSLRREKVQSRTGLWMQHWYRYENLATSHWGVGYKSVGSYFRAHEQDWSSWMHR